jgi:ATP dependent DNA ligase domain
VCWTRSTWLALQTTLSIIGSERKTVIVYRERFATCRQILAQLLQLPPDSAMHPCIFWSLSGYFSLSGSIAVCCSFSFSFTVFLKIAPPIYSTGTPKNKAALKKLLRRKRSRILYLDHVESDGRLLFEQIIAMDLEGIVCKRKDSPYKVTEKPSRHWIKVQNPRYSQLEGRDELFERA